MLTSQLFGCSLLLASVSFGSIATILNHRNIFPRSIALILRVASAELYDIDLASHTPLLTALVQRRQILSASRLIVVMSNEQ